MNISLRKYKNDQAYLNHNHKGNGNKKRYFAIKCKLKKI